MATLEMNVRQVNSDFQAIKNKIVEKGVNVEDGTKTSEYASKVNDVYEAGYEKGKAEGGDFVNIRTNNGQNFAYLYCAVSHLVTAPVVDTSKGIRFDYMFNGCSNLVTVPLLNVSNASSTFAASLNFIFGNCPKLENITFEGTIPKSISFNTSSKLSKASIESIINALSTTTSGLSVTFSKTAVENAFTDEEWTALIATKPNWTINLV